MLVASGYIYTNNDYYTPLDFQVNFFKGFFKMMVFDFFEEVRVQEASVLNVEDLLAVAKQDLVIAF